MSYENGESRYDNYFSDDKDTVTVSLNMNSTLHSGYSKDVNHYIFEIVDGSDAENGYNYVSRGTYTLKNNTDEEVVYERISNEIPRLLNAPTIKTTKSNPAVETPVTPVSNTDHRSFHRDPNNKYYDESTNPIFKGEQVELIEHAINMLKKSGYKVIK